MSSDVGMATAAGAANVKRARFGELDEEQQSGEAFNDARDLYGYICDRKLKEQYYM